MSANPHYEYTKSDESRWTRLLARDGPAALCAVSGFLSAFTVSLVGQMPVGEVILLILLPWILIKTFLNRGSSSRLHQLGWFRLLLVLAGCMLFGYIVSDLFRNTSWGNLSRGWARVAFLGIDLVSIAYLIDQSWKRLQVFILALYVGYTVAALINGPLYGDWWQFGLGYTLTAFAFFFCGGRTVLIQVLVMAAMGVLSLALGARSLGGISLLAAGLLGLRYARGILRPVAIVFSLGAMLALASAASGVFRDNQDHTSSNIERQSMIETAGEAFTGSPLIGQGSWFTASRAIRQLEEKRRIIDPSFKGYTDEEARMLSIHSQLLVALAEGGILGGAFFIGMAVLLLKTIRHVIREPVPHRAFVLLIVLLGLWNLCMSPFSGVARVEIVLAICTCLLVMLQRRGELEEDYRE
jgi:O-antigen ligase